MNLGISQKYFIVALPKKGQFSVSNTKAPVGVGLLVAGLIDLQMGGVIQIENKKITVISGLTDELKYLKPLYDVLKTKEKMSIMNLTNIYVTSILKNPFLCTKPVFLTLCKIRTRFLLTTMENGKVVTGQRNRLLVIFVHPS